MKDIATFTIDTVHHLQRQMLLKLRQLGAQSYQQLKPQGIEGNAFNYHLKLLKKSGLIELNDQVYQLTPTGLIVTDSFSFEKQRLVVRPHSFTYLYATQGDKILIYRPSREPVAGKICLPSGKVHYGDDFEESIAREASRRGLTNEYTATFLCAINMRFIKSDEIVMQRPGNVWHLEYDGPTVTVETASGFSEWVSQESLEDNILPDIRESMKRSHEGQHDPIDCTYAF
jgi:hypothetical protein